MNPDTGACRLESRKPLSKKSADDPRQNIAAAGGRQVRRGVGVDGGAAVRRGDDRVASLKHDESAALRSRRAGAVQAGACGRKEPAELALMRRQHHRRQPLLNG